MKIIKEQTSQTKKIQLMSNGSVSVLSYNDATGIYDLNYTIDNGGDAEFEMQIFFNLK